MPKLLLLLTFIFLHCSAETLLGQNNSETSHTNFIIIFTDDLGYGDVGSSGTSLIQTPNINKMESEGVKLTHHYSSANVCTPSRAGLLTGRYPIRSGLAENVLFPNSDHGLPHDEITIAGALKEKGYNTAMFGKWHLGTVDVSWPDHHGFDYFYGLPYSNDMQPLPIYRNRKIVEEPTNQSTLTQRLTEEAVQFIEQQSDNPFFVYLAHPMPHVPLYVSEEFEGQSNAGLYGDVIEEIDWSVGQILNTINRLDLDDNTLVIFTSDNGPWFEGSAGDLRDRKGGMSWEGGFRVPFIARWPENIPQGTVSDAITMNFDVFPTLLEIADIENPQDRIIDGKNIMTVLQGDDQSPHEFLYFFNNEEITAIRSQRWKFVIRTYYREGFGRFDVQKPNNYVPGLLFDLELDPSEQFSFTRENPEVVSKMIQRLTRGKEELESLGKNHE